MLTNSTAARRRITAKEIPVIKATILNDQDGECALCDAALTVETGCLDHNHKSGLIRGVLCRNCNGIEGKVHNLARRAKRARAAKDWLGRLILYWIKHEADHSGLYHPTFKTDDEKRVRKNKRARTRRIASKEE